MKTQRRRSNVRPVQAKSAYQELRNATLSQLQDLNNFLYKAQNDRLGYDLDVMTTKIASHSGKLLKAERKNNLETVSYNVCMAFSWSMAMANRLHLDIEAEIWNRFPGVCPYCGQPVCSCKSKRAKNRKKVIVDPRLRPATCHQYQLMFARIYPQTFRAAVGHMAEEMIEILIEIRNYLGTHLESVQEHAIEELVDVITTMFAVATTAGLDLATEMQHHFGNGCPGCTESPCNCGYADRIEGL